MFRARTSATDAYRVLGLEEGTPLEVVKSTYKQLALKTHPDKNPGNEEATAQFQKLGEAYNVLLKYLDTSSPQHRGPHMYPFGSEYGGDYDDYDDDDGDYDDDDEYYSDEDDMLREAFARFLFEQMMNDRSSRRTQHNFFHAHYHHDHAPPESDEAFQARLRRQREEQEAAAARRQREEDHKKAVQAEEREKERKAAEKRREAKASKKKANAEAQRKTAEQTAKTQQQRTQTLRSSIFTAARSGDSKKVKKGVWEDSVDAAGGEIKPGCEAFVKPKPADPFETLAHIAAKGGDQELLEWLDTHGADLEERDSQGLTPFHVALHAGHLPVLRYILEAHPFTDDPTMYTSPPGKTLSIIALECRDPEVLWLVLNEKMVSHDDMAQTWAYVTSDSGRRAILTIPGPKSGAEKLDEYTNLLAKFGDFSLNPADEAPAPEESGSETSASTGGRLSPHASEGQTSSSATPQSGTPRSPSPQENKDRSHPSQSQSPSASAPPSNGSRGGRPFNGRGRGRGRGGNRARGRGARGNGNYRGRDSAPS